MHIISFITLFTGRVFDKDGNLNDWWSQTDEKKFKDKAQCIIDQYGSFVVPGTGNMTVTIQLCQIFMPVSVDY